MPSVITAAGRQLIADRLAAQLPLEINTVNFASVAFPDPTNPPAPSPGLTALEGTLQASVAVSGVGKIAEDQVVYSGYLDTSMGDFTINQIGYFADDAPNPPLLVMVHNIPPVYKRANGPGVSGNSYKHSGILSIQDAAQAAQVSIPPETWQFDWSEQLALKENQSAKGQAGGYAALDGAGDVPLAQLPDALSGKDADLLDGQHGAFYRNAANLDAGTLPAARFDDTAHGSRAGGALHAAGTVAVAGFLAAADKAKLDGIEPGASADQAPAELLAALLTVDGAASGLDADLLDGQQGSFYRNAANLDAGILPAARFNDTAHGNRAGGALHAAATVAVAGFLAAADKAKLDGIEAGATADQTPAELLSALKTVDGAGSGLDADLLDGAQPDSGGVADTIARRDGAGDLNTRLLRQSYNLANGDGSFFLTQNAVGDVADNFARPMALADVRTALGGAGGGLDADLLDGQQGSFYRNAGNLNAGTLPAARFNDTAHGNRAGGALHAAATPTVSGFLAAADKSKLDGIEAGASADQTAAELLTALKTVDGAASGLDADLLDGQHAAAFAAAAHGHNAATGAADGFMAAADKAKLDGIETGATADMSAAELLAAIKTVDGAGSGLDADLLDGQQASAFQTRSEKGAANGYAGLDAGGTVPDAQIPAGITRDAEVATLVAGFAVGSVGSYAFLVRLTGAEAGATAPGSECWYSNAGGNGISKPTGTWRCMGKTYNDGGPAGSTLWLRIA